MNEVEKLYELAGVEKIELDYPDNFDPFYPDFTAEKQLELLKFCFDKYERLEKVRALKERCIKTIK